MVNSGHCAETRRTFGSPAGHPRAILSLIVLIACLAFFGCSAPTPLPIAELKDDAGMFTKRESASFRGRLKSLAERKGIAVVVRTSAATVTRERISTHLDEVFRNEPAWPTPAPSLFRKVIEAVSFARSGNAPDEAIEIVLLKNPSFLGVRYGPRLQWRALTAGFLFGPAVFGQQLRAFKGEPKTALDEFLTLLDTTLRELTWYERALENEATFELAQVIEELTLANWGLYNRYLLAPILNLQLLARRVFVSPVIASVVVVLASLLALRAVLSLVGLAMRRPRSLRYVFVFGVALPLELIVGLPSVGSLLVFCGGRLEDQLYMSHVLGLARNMYFTDLPAAIGSQTGLILGGALALVVAATYISNRLWIFPLVGTPEEFQSRTYSATRNSFDMFVDGIVAGEGISDKHPYDDLATTFVQTAIGIMFRWTIVFAIIPLGAAVYLALRSATNGALGLRSNINALRTMRRIAKGVQAPVEAIG